MKVLIAHAPRLLVDELMRRDHELVVAHFPRQWPDDEPATNRCHFVSFPVRQKFDPRAIIDMRRLVMAHAPDLIHAFTPRSLAAAVLATIGMRSPPKIFSFRGISSPPKWIDPADRITYLSPRVTGHGCESEAVAAALVGAGIDRESCHVVYNCVNSAATSAPDRNDVRDRFGIPRDAFVVGTVACIRPVKGIDLLLRAALECLEFEDLHLLLVGPNRDAAVKRLMRSPQWNGRLHAPGFIPAGGAMAAGFDLFVMPSREEALCRALLEAMSLGTCPIVSDAGGMKEVVRHGQDGLVIPKGDVPALAAAIRHLHGHRDLIHQFGQAAWTRVRTMCSPAAMADRVERAYEAMIPSLLSFSRGSKDRSHRRAA